MVSYTELTSILFCPDDQGDLKIENNIPMCTVCKREFVVKDNFVDMRPKDTLTIVTENNIESIYRDYYNYLKTNSQKSQFQTFGLVSKSISEGFVNETLTHIKKYVNEHHIVCDVGAGSGDYSIEVARRCKVIFHCDLDFNGIKISQEKAKTKNIHNVYFVRCDYFRLPFKKNSIDIVYTIDILERGKTHDESLLSEIDRVVKTDSLVLFDCHAKERSHLTRILPNSISTYTKEEALGLAKRHFVVEDVVGTGYVPQIRKWPNFEYSIFNPIAKLAKFPPARWFVACKKA